MTKTTLTPSEHSAAVGGMQYVEQVCHAEQASVSAATIGRYIVLRKGHVPNFYMTIVTAGTAGQNDVEIQKNGVQIGSTGTIAGDAGNDGAVVSTGIAADVDEGDVLTVVVSAAASAGSPAGLAVDVPIVHDFDA